jgi:chorismate mutase
LHLSHEDGVLEQNRALASNSEKDILKCQSEILTHVGHRKKSTAIDSALTVNEDVSATFAQKLVKEILEFGIPIENIDEQAVLRVQTHIVLGERLAVPRRARIVVRTIDNMRNAILRHERWR